MATPTRPSAHPRPRMVRLNGHDSESPLICFHPVDGGLGAYRTIVSDLPSHISITGLQAASGAGQYASIDRMAETYADTIGEMGRCESYRLLGYSFGAEVAMRVAAILERRRQRVEFVGIVDWVPFGAGDIRAQVHCLSTYLFTLHRHLSQKFSMLRELPSESLWPSSVALADCFLSRASVPSLQTVIGCFRDAGLVADDAPEYAIRQFIEPLFSRLALLKSDSPMHVTAPLYVWRAKDGIGAGHDSWSVRTSGHCEEVLLAGDHLTVMQPPVAQGISNRLVELIEPSCFAARAANTEA